MKRANNVKNCETAKKNFIGAKIQQKLKTAEREKKVLKVPKFDGNGQKNLKNNGDGRVIHKN